MRLHPSPISHSTIKFQPTRNKDKKERAATKASRNWCAAQPRVRICSDMSGRLFPSLLAYPRDDYQSINISRCWIDKSWQIYFLHELASNLGSWKNEEWCRGKRWQIIVQYEIELIILGPGKPIRWAKPNEYTWQSPQLWWWINVANPIITSIGDGSLGSPHYVDWERYVCCCFGRGAWLQGSKQVMSRLSNPLPLILNPGPPK